METKNDINQQENQQTTYLHSDSFEINTGKAQGNVSVRIYQPRENVFFRV